MQQEQKVLVAWIRFEWWEGVLVLWSLLGWLYHLDELAATQEYHLGSLQCCAADVRVCGRWVGTYQWVASVSSSF